MDIKSEYYPEYIGSIVALIPKEALHELIDEFAINSKFYMSSEVDSEATAKINSAVVALLLGKFRYMPLSLIAEAYTKGSLGELGGTTRFTVRNVYIWLAAMDEKCRRLNQEKQSKLDSDKRAEEEKAYKKTQKRNSLYGTAFYWKVSHCPMSDSEYDRLSLDKIVEAFEKGYSFRELQPGMIL